MYYKNKSQLNYSYGIVTSTVKSSINRSEIKEWKPVGNAAMRKGDAKGMTWQILAR